MVNAYRLDWIIPSAGESPKQRGPRLVNAIGIPRAGTFQYRTSNLMDGMDRLVDLV
jgi:hypothetical protein